MEEEKKLFFILEVCRLLYNSFLAIWVTIQPIHLTPIKERV